MGRRVKHIHAKPDEYVRVHRDRRPSRGGGGGDEVPWWVWLIGIIIVSWLVGVIIDFIEAHWVAIVSIIGAGVLLLLIWLLHEQIGAGVLAFGRWLRKTWQHIRQRNAESRSRRTQGTTEPEN